MALKYAFMSFSCPELTLAEMLKLAADLGYNGIEPRAQAGHKHGVEIDADAQAREEIKALAADSGIALCCLAVSCRYADPETVEENVSDTLHAIDLAADIGVPHGST
jgi:sugar phosphate isomerase/epimerase